MKKLFLIFALFLFVTSLAAQEKFVVPEISDAKKYARMLGEVNGLVLNSISYAKSQGNSVEDLAKFTGENYKKSWNKERGWEGFARGIINSWVLIVPNNKIVILEQSVTMVKFKSKTPFARLKNNGPRNNVSHLEYMTFLKTNQKIIGNHMGATISFKDVEDGIILTIKKK